MRITDPRYVAGVENFTMGIIKAAKEGAVDQDAAARAIRVIFSQANDRYGKFFVGLPENVFTNTELFLPILTKFTGQVEKVQRSQNYFGNVVQGHHGISVSSLEAASRHLSTADRMKFLEEFDSRYGGGGTDESAMFPITNLGHQSSGKAKGAKDVYNAHVDSNPSVLVDSYAPNQGTWQAEDFSNITDPGQLADEFWNRSGSPQIRLAELAFDQPNELTFRQKLANRVGVRERDLYAKPAKLRAALDKMGIGKQEALKLMQESYGMTYVPPDTNAFKYPRPERSKKPPFSHKVLTENLAGIEKSRAIAQQASTALPVKTPKRIPSIDVKGGLGGAALGAGLAYLMGDNASQAAAGSIPIVSDIESTNTGVAERAGTNIFVDPRTNRLMPTDPSQVGMGLAYLNGKPVAVPYGSVAGTKSNGQILQEAGQQIVDVNRGRLQRAAQSVVEHFQPKPIPVAKPKPIGNGQGGITKPKGSSVKSGQPLLSQNNLKWALKQLGLRR